VVLICADPRPTRPPFDVSQRHIVYYSLDSPSDFKKLQDYVSIRLKAQIKKAEAMRTVASLSSIKPTEGLSSYEMAALVAIMENRLTPDAEVTPGEVQQGMRKAGYTELAISLSLESLSRKGTVEFDQAGKGFGNEYTTCVITPKGVEWLMENQGRFRLRVEKRQETDEGDATGTAKPKCF
jgi:hypothetical protein